MKVVPEWKIREKIDKTKILYEEIDPNIQEICKLFNSLFFLATTTSCEGHPIYDGKEWTAIGGLGIEIYADKKWHALIGLFDKECQADYKHFNIGISRGLRYLQTKGFIVYTDGISWCARGLTKEECEEQLKSVWCKLEFYLRKFIELEKVEIDWEIYLRERKKS